MGFGLYDTFLHIDTGSGRTWKGAKASWFISAITAAGWSPGKKGLSGIAVKKGTTDDTSTPSANSDATTPPSNLDASKIQNSADAKQYSYNYLKSKGYSDVAAAGILGHAQAESGFNPSAFNSAGGGNGAVGLFQWRGDRAQSLYNFAGTTSPSITQQLDFMDYELKKNPGGVAGSNTYANVTGASNPDQAASAFAGYERYTGWNSAYSADTTKRRANARDIFSQFSGQSAAQSTTGFIDPTNSLPSSEYRGEPSTNQAARGFNRVSSQHKIVAKDSGRITGMPAAGDLGTFGEPELRAAPQYPFNKVMASRTGHIFEMDDTPEVERLNLEHKSGSGLEIFANGDLVKRSKGNNYDMNTGDSFVGVLGKYFITSVNDMHIRSTADLLQQADGSLNITIGNDGGLHISGDYVVSVGEDIQIKSGGKISIHSASNVEILSDANVNIEAKGTLNLKGKEVNIESSGDLGLKGSNVNIDDTIHMAEGKTKSVDGADVADVGSPGPRKTIQKDNLKTNTNSGARILTTEEVASHYSSQNKTLGV